MTIVKENKINKKVNVFFCVSRKTNLMREAGDSVQRSQKSGQGCIRELANCHCGMFVEEEGGRESTEATNASDCAHAHIKARKSDLQHQKCEGAWVDGIESFAQKSKQGEEVGIERELILHKEATQDGLELLALQEMGLSGG